MRGYNYSTVIILVHTSVLGEGEHAHAVLDVVELAVLVAGEVLLGVAHRLQASVLTDQFYELLETDQLQLSTV